MSNVFISYKSEDRDRIQPIISTLRFAGLDVWWDQDIRAGDPWEASIEGALSRAKVVLVFWTEKSVDSKLGARVQVEAREGLEREVIVQVLLDPIDPPLFFRHFQAISLKGWSGNTDAPAWRKLLQSIEHLMQGKSLQSATEAFSRKATSASQLGLRPEQRKVLVNGVPRYISDYVVVAPPIPYHFDARPAYRGFEHKNRFGYKFDKLADVGDFVEREQNITRFYDYPPMLGPIAFGSMGKDFAVLRSPARGLLFWLSRNGGMGSLSAYKSHQYDPPSIGLGIALFEGEDLANVDPTAVYDDFAFQVGNRFDDFQHKSGRGKEPPTLDEDLRYLAEGHLWIGSIHDIPFDGHNRYMPEILRDQICIANQRTIG